MKTFWKFVSIPLLSVCLLSSAGWSLHAIGAGNDVDTSFAVEQTTATLTIAHFAPFADSVVDTTVTVRVDGADVFSNFAFAGKVTGVSLSAGPHLIEIVPADSDEPVISVTQTFTEGEEYTVAAIGGANDWPLDLYIVENDNQSQPDVGRIRVTHLSPFAEVAGLTQIDVCTEDGNPIAGLTNIGYLDSSGYLTLTPGIYRLNIAAAGTSCSTIVEQLPAFSLIAGQFADIFAIGLPTSSELPLQISQTGLAARVAVGHFAPFASEFISTAVDIQVANSEVISNFTFGRLTPYFFVPLGNLPVEIFPAGSNEPVMTDTVVISGFVDFTFAAVGDTLNQPLELLRTVDDNATPPSEGKGRLVAQHLAPFAANQAGTVVDLCAEVGEAPLLSGLAYKERAVLDLDVGKYKTFVAPPGANCSQALIDLPEFVVGEGRIAKALVIGNQSTIPFIFATIPNIEAQYIFVPALVTSQVANE